MNGCENERTGAGALQVAVYATTGASWCTVFADGREAGGASSLVLPEAQILLRWGEMTCTASPEKAPARALRIADGEDTAMARLCRTGAAHMLQTPGLEATVEADADGYRGSAAGRLLFEAVPCAASELPQQAQSFDLVRAYRLCFYAPLPPAAALCAAVFPMLRLC